MMYPLLLFERGGDKRRVADTDAAGLESLSPYSSPPAVSASHLPTYVMEMLNCAPLPRRRHGWIETHL